ncbi:MAG: hypothetical protein JXB50_05355 [Spirochaetes bacterium]|nr:hypothetical protein [Spirochaetota bacterium]
MKIKIAIMLVVILISFFSCAPKNTPGIWKGKNSKGDTEITFNISLQGDLITSKGNPLEKSCSMIIAVQYLNLDSYNLELTRVIPKTFYIQNDIPIEANGAFNFNGNNCQVEGKITNNHASGSLIFYTVRNYRQEKNIYSWSADPVNIK